MRHRFARSEDAELLAQFNHQLIQDEGHRNAMTIPELVDRMGSWLANDYRASIFEDGSSIVAYALYREEIDNLYLRQFFVQRARRRTGIGRACVNILFSDIWPQDKRITVDVLCLNPAGIGFWRAMGFTDYCLTLEVYPDLRAKVGSLHERT
jgi:ribosomal protein S18 acetylase RimI-like enzyme